ncbi:toxin VasX [Gilliamella sp. BG6]|uniref:toxin VasX n=1 Tax=unclassified Gilliamella TaxID=2685620 RepID=UPI0039875F0B
MKKTANTAIENKDEAAGHCLACERTGLPVFLLRQAVIKTKFNKIKQVNQTYQELANYTKTLDFKQRMPDEALKYYDYVLRTLRNGYVYVMQQQGDDIESRILHVYECIDGALRLKNFLELTNTEPRPISKACKDACHTIPASFINLNNKEFTQAWVAYSSQPWPKKTLDDYLKEQDSQVLSRFTKIDIQKLKDSPSEATGKRAVPFKDIFGYSHEHDDNDKSKVLEFRFGERGLENFKSAHPFTSLKNQRQKFANHANLLYQGNRPISCGVVLEDTFGIAEELNTQRISHLHMFNEKPLTTEEVNLAEELIDGFDDLDKATKIYEQRAKNMIQTINPVLKNQFNYYQPDMFKKRVILQLMDQYRTSIVTSFDREIARVKEEIKKVKNSGNDTIGYNGIPTSARMHQKIGKLSEDKTKVLNDFDSCVDQGKVDTFKGKLETAYKEVVDYHKEWSQDYFTYLRWLFGKQGIVSQFSKTKPKSVNTNHFWQREFDFSTETTRLAHASEIGSILVDTTHSEIKLDQDSALWDELLSNPESIYYITEYNNSKGIDRDEKVYVDLKTNELITPKDWLSKATEFIGTVSTTIAEKKGDKDLNDKKSVLEKNKAELEAKIEQNKQKIDELEQQKKQIPVSDPVAQEKLRREKKAYETKNRELNKSLEAVNKELSNLANSTQQTHASTKYSESLLNRTALKKQATLAKDTLLKPIKSHWMRLNAFDELARLGALPVEINVQIRPENIVKIQNLLTQMHRGFYHRGVYHPHELAFLESFDIDEKPIKTDSGKMQKAKFTLCFPDKASKALFVDFINGTNGTLSPYSLKQFMEQKYKDYFKLIHKQKTLLENIEKVNQGKASITDKLRKISDKALERAKAKINEKISKAGGIIDIAQHELERIYNEIDLQTANQNVKTGKITFGINLAVSGILGTLTLINISDMLKEWDEVKEGNGETELKGQMLKDLVSLVLTGIDLSSQYKNIKLNMQMAEAIKAGKDVTKIEAKLRFNSIISKTVAGATAAITVLEAIGELKSSFDMMNMEDNLYFQMRVGGSIALGFGAVIVALAGSWITVIVGAILMIGGSIAIMFSKKYDNYTAIQHWLNRCCFGKQEELDYLGYQAYHEDEYSTHAGFGLALNDYAIIVYNIQTFIRLKPLYHAPSSTPMPDAPNQFQRHIYFYLDIPDFAKYNQNETAIAMIRLFINDYPNLKSEPDPLPEKYIDLKYRITSQQIALLAISKNYGDLNLIWTDKKAYFEKYDRNIDILTRLPIPDYSKIDEPDEFTLTTSANHLTDKTITNSDKPVQNGLIINKWIAGTIGVFNIVKYQIIIQYNNREDVPLIVTKNNKI